VRVSLNSRYTLSELEAACDDCAPRILFTDRSADGTTDRTKGVVPSHRSKLSDAMSLIASVDLSHEDRRLVMSPMFRAAGSFNILPCFWVGSTQSFLPRFDAEAALRAVETYRLTITFGVPTICSSLPVYPGAPAGRSAPVPRIGTLPCAAVATWGSPS
jgi:acyl-CoA synthetase (AMP-forming)/AMP-acid ligase II